MARVGELAELAGDEVRGLLADVDGMVADALEAAGDEDHAQAPLASLVICAEVEQVVDLKPFSMKKLVARVGAAARRGTRAQEPRRGDEIRIAELRLDPRTRRRTWTGRAPS